MVFNIRYFKDEFYIHIFLNQRTCREDRVTTLSESYMETWGSIIGSQSRESPIKKVKAGIEANGSSTKLTEGIEIWGALKNGKTERFAEASDEIKSKYSINHSV